MTLRKASSFDDLDAKKIAPSGLLKGFFFLTNSHKNKDEHDEKKLSVSTYRKSDEKENSLISEEANHSFRSNPKNVFTTNDLSNHDHSYDQQNHTKTIYLKNVKKSEILFLQTYRLVLAEFEYRAPPKKVIKVELLINIHKLNINRWKIRIINVLDAEYS